MNDHLKALLKEKGMTQRELAKKANLTEAAVSKYCSGYQTPHLDVLCRIAVALDVTPDALYGLAPKTGSETYENVRQLIAMHKGEWSESDKMKLILLLSKE